MNLFNFVRCVLFASVTVSSGIAALAQANQISKSTEVSKDFAGRTIPPLAHELIDMVRPPDIPGKRTAGLPGWVEKEGAGEAGHEFLNINPRETLFHSKLSIMRLYKDGHRVGVIRKIHPDLSWQIMDVFHHAKNEWMTERCDTNGHSIPPDHLLLGVMRKGDPRKPPVPPRPTEVEQIQYLKANFGRHMPRSCVGDTQKARIAATLNLQTGKLVHYTVKPVICISPFFDPCTPDGTVDNYSGQTPITSSKQKASK